MLPNIIDIRENFTYYCKNHSVITHIYILVTFALFLYIFKLINMQYSRIKCMVMYDLNPSFLNISRYVQIS